MIFPLADIHLEEDLDELDLISIVEERIPKYRLRADTLTRFAAEGLIEDSDWIVPNPALPKDYDLDLSPELAKETLKYFGKKFSLFDILAHPYPHPLPIVGWLKFSVIDFKYRNTRDFLVLILSLGLIKHTIIRNQFKF